MDRHLFIENVFEISILFFVIIFFPLNYDSNLSNLHYEESRSIFDSVIHLIFFIHFKWFASFKGHIIYFT